MDPIQLYAIERYDALFQIIAPTNKKSLSTVDPARVARAQKGNRPFTEKYFARIEDRSLRWNITAWPTQAAAQEAEMGLLAYTEFVYNACGLDHDDPVAYWHDLEAHQQQWVDWLNGKRRAEVKGPGIDLSFNFEGRVWINSKGDVNFPSGEIFTSPIEDSVNGHVEFSFPTVYGGREINGVRLTFKNGRVIEASAAKGEDYLFSQLDLDEGARTLGEFAIGSNYGIQQFTGETLFDEKIGGTVHMALGQGFEEAHGVNKSQVHWDMVHDMKNGGAIRIDGELFHKNGQFVVN
jgi:aminopeptidase